MSPEEADAPDEKRPERTQDGHHIIVNGRKWRATDPSIPDTFRQELVDELMSARRAVKSSESGARRRVHDAKTALGERGAPWWEEGRGQDFDERIAAAVRALTRKRAESSICPSDVARAIGGASWRSRMDDVRRVAAELAARNEVVVTQKGEPVSIESARGPVRIIRGPAL
ncbi:MULTISPECIES: DUF3253 domain-containing protein [unclassified Microbacterium]|uniref:DUF3253 domain-containing protein n=1 Tax=unclassified Microbacterium TaxID=2609290 RepID=UPI000EA89BA8|nr:MULTISPECIES: DUF3253 domain-containing protein [unclassified Microbacterium]MBT2484075.1 DUF3253 domain-containing protein [Microbacterium sp. ISL-108]RKN67026.1 DUF3253 domain-containing protein [Microbacterium sp. CGR2]